MRIYKKLLLMSVLCLAITGCGNNETSNNETSKKEEIAQDTVIQEEVSTEESIDEAVADNADKQVADITTEATDKEYVHDAGYTELIHDGFAMYFQELMETIYSRVNYSELGTPVEEITPMNEQVMIQVEEMTTGLNPIQDGEILGIIKEARELFDQTNNIVKEKKYERLSSLDEVGQEIYNEYYEWLIEAAAHHKHDH
nr:hypothetical protein [uncultured Cellulosilyticum sp.]